MTELGKERSECIPVDVNLIDAIRNGNILTLQHQYPTYCPAASEGGN